MKRLCVLVALLCLFAFAAETKACNPFGVNVAVGGSKVSSHMDGWAIDVSSTKMTPIELCHKVEELGIKFDQMIHEFGRWMHISFAPEMRQQKLTIFKPEGKYKPGILTEAEYHAA